MMKTLGIFLFITVISLNSQAQDPQMPRQFYFFLGVGLPMMKVKDEGHSPLKYQGWIPTVRLGYEAISKTAVSRIAISAALGVAKPQSKPKAQRNPSSTDVTNIQFSYAYYKRTGGYNTEGWNTYVGGAVNFTFDIRNYTLPSNNLVGYQANASLNMGAFAQNKLSEQWRFNYEAFTPLLSYTLRPNYLGMLPMKGTDFNAKNVFSNGKIVTMNKFFRFYNRFSFDQQIKDYRQRRLFYSWDYHSNTVSKNLKSVFGGLGYESLFKM